jgi:hypothetical protein
MSHLARFDMHSPSNPYRVDFHRPTPKIDLYPPHIPIVSYARDPTWLEWHCREDILPAVERKKEGTAPPAAKPKEQKVESKADPMDIDIDAPQGTGGTLPAITPAKDFVERRDDVNAAVAQQQA